MEKERKRVSLYERLPEIYRIRDEEQSSQYKCMQCGYIYDEQEKGISFYELKSSWTCPACGGIKEFFEYLGQLKSYLSLCEDIFSELHKNIEALYHDLFIETCDDWVIPYIGDLLGVSHLKGDPATLRADVAETIALRRRKGTLAGMERLTYNLTRWGVHCVELRENLVWNQHLNHQRPYVGGDSPYAGSSVTRFTPVRGGTVPISDPAMLTLLYTPFDPFAHTADIKPPDFGNIRYNLPNLAIFLWRLKDYRIKVSKPVYKEKKIIGSVQCVRFDVHPMGNPVRLFNTYQFDPDKEPPLATQLDETPGPIPMARLIENSYAGASRKYVSIDTYDHTNTTLNTIDISDVGFQLHLPQSEFNQTGWTIRGANLCNWEDGILPSVKNREIIIDPVIGRFLIGVKTSTEAEALRNYLLITYTYGAVGPTGAYPITRSNLPEKWQGNRVKTIDIIYKDGKNELKDALNKMDESQYRDYPVLILINDSRTYELDIDKVKASLKKNEGGEISLLLQKSLIIRASDDQRPVIKLIRPLMFRPQKVKGDDANEQIKLDAIMDSLTVRLEGIYLTRGDKWDTTFAPNPEDEPLVARVALNSLELIGSTLDPGGFKKLNGKRTPMYSSVKLKTNYGFNDTGEQKAFNQIPEVIINRSIVGPLLIDTDYQLSLMDSIIDAGKGVNDNTEGKFALSSSDHPKTKWGPLTQFKNITVFGRVRVEKISSGKGGIFVQTIEVLDHQTGCIKFSYFLGKNDRLPPNHGCVKGTEALLRFVSEIFGQPAYGQLHHTTDFRIRERGPADDAMGAFGFLMDAHKWRNVQIRYREFMPVSIRPLLIPVT